MKAAWSPEMMAFSSFRGSPMMAVPFALRGTSSNSPPDSMRSLTRSDWYSAGLVVGPPP
jgi:hypothetical protein